MTTSNRVQRHRWKQTPRGARRRAKGARRPRRPSRDLRLRMERSMPDHRLHPVLPQHNMIAKDVGSQSIDFSYVIFLSFCFSFCLVALSMIISGCYARIPYNGNGQGRPLPHNKIIIQAGFFLRNGFGLLPATHLQKRTEKSLLYLSPCFDFFSEEILKAGQKNCCVYVYVMGRGEREEKKSLRTQQEDFATARLPVY